MSLENGMRLRHINIVNILGIAGFFFESKVIVWWVYLFMSLLINGVGYPLGGDM